MSTEEKNEHTNNNDREAVHDQNGQGFQEGIQLNNTDETNGGKKQRMKPVSNDPPAIETGEGEEWNAPIEPDTSNPGENETDESIEKEPQPESSRSEPQDKDHEQIQGNIGRDGIFSESFNAENVYINSPHVGQKGQGFKRIDPTKAFEFPKNYTDFKIESGLVDAGRKLMEESLVLISCDDHEIAVAGAKHLTQYCEGKDWTILRRFSKRDVSALDFGDPSITEAKTDHMFSLNFLLYNIKKIGRNSTVIIDLTSEYSIEDARYFLSPFSDPEAQSGYFSSIRRVLSENYLRIICLAPQRIADSEILKGRVHVWNLGPLKTLVYHYFPSNSEELYRSLLEQISRKKWSGEPLDAVRIAINNGNFKDLIKRYDKSKKNENKEDEAGFIEYLSEENSIAALLEAVLFTAIYFPKLSEPHFEFVLSILVGDEPLVDPRINSIEGDEKKSKVPFQTGSDRSQETKETSETKDYEVKITMSGDDISIMKSNRESSNKEPDAQRSTHDGPNESLSRPREQTGNLTSREKPKTLMDLWRLGARKKISQYAKITLISIPNGRNYIWFKEPHLSALALEALKETDPFYFSKYFVRILESGLVFNNSKDIAESTLELIRQRMLLNPDLYDFKWLTAWVGKALFVLDLAQEIQPENLEQLSEQLQIISQEPLYMIRWTQLLRMMLGDEKLSKVANEFLSSLIDLQQHDRILQFTSRLKDASGFNAMHWIKRLIAEGNPKMRARALNFLANYIRYNSTQRPEIFSTLIEWLPEKESTDFLPPLQETALVLPILLTVNAILEFDLNINRTPSYIFPIVLIDSISPDTMGESTPKTSEILSDFLTIMLHPRQGFNYPLSKGLVTQLIVFLFLDIRIKVTVPKKDKRQKTGFIASVYLSKWLLEDKIFAEHPYDNLLALILVSWSWMLYAGPKESQDRIIGESRLAQICLEYNRRLPNHRTKRIRSFISKIRKLISNAKLFIPSSEKKNKKRLSRFRYISKTVGNCLYKNRNQ